MADLLVSPESGSNPALEEYEHDEDEMDNAEASTSLLPAKKTGKEGKTPRSVSCSACRLRRVKCSRKPNEKTCLPCEIKGIACTPVPPKQRKLPNRSGKRIEEAKGLFGAHVAQAVTQQSQAVLSPTSKTSQLATGQIQGGLLSSVIDIFFQLPDSRLTILSGTTLIGEFEKVSRRRELLDPVQGALISVLAALGARVSDHPLIAGPHAPRLEHLTPEQNLLPSGKARTSACQVLMEQAIKDIDEAGVMRKPSMESMCCLIIAQGLIPVDAEPELRKTGQAYAAAMMSHVRSILHDPDTPQSIRNELSEGEVGWSIFSRDALTASDDSRGPLLSDNDIDLLVGRTSVPILEIFQPAFFSWQDPTLAFLMAFRSIFHHLCMSCRRAATSLTSYRALRSPRVDEVALRELIDNLALVGAALPLLEEKATAWVGPPGTSGLSFSTDLNMLIWSLVRTVRMARAAHLMTPYRIVSSRLHGVPMPGPIEPPPDHSPNLEEAIRVQSQTNQDAAYAHRLYALADDVAALAFRGARELTQQLELLMLTGMPLVMISATSAMFLQAKLWCKPMTAALTVEEGGPAADFTFDVKIKELSSIARAMRFAAWAYDVSPTLGWLDEEIRKVKNQHAQHLLKLSLGYSPSMATGSTVSPPSFNDPMLANQLPPTDFAFSTDSFTTPADFANPLDCASSSNLSFPPTTQGPGSLNFDPDMFGGPSPFRHPPTAHEMDLLNARNLGGTSTAPQLDTWAPLQESQGLELPDDLQAYVDSLLASTSEGVATMVSDLPGGLPNTWYDMPTA